MNNKRWCSVRKKGIVKYVLVDGLLMGLSMGFFAVVFQIAGDVFINNLEIELHYFIEKLMTTGILISLLGFPVAYFSWKDYEKKFIQ